MSINSAMLAGVSGLAANSTALAAISNNIANVNTTAYKRVATNFSAIVTDSSSSGGYSAGGVIADTRQQISSPALLQRTNSDMDLGIDGQGFFVVTEKSENLTNSDTRLFTRAGSFAVDKYGYLQNASGYYLQGWPVDALGNVVTDPSDMSKLGSINVSSVGGAAEATTRVVVNANLSDGQALSARVGTVDAAGNFTAAPAATAYDPASATNSMAVYDIDAGTGVEPDFEISIPVSDSKGGQRNITMRLLKSETANTWYAEMVSPDITTGTPAGQLASGTLTFTQDGRLDTANSTLFGTPYNSTLTVGASGTAGTPRWMDILGVGDQTISLDLEDATAGLTQLNSTSIVQSVVTNGTAFGNLATVQVSKDGIVTAIYDNGVTRNIAQVALATFVNPDGLIPVNGNSYIMSRDSGTFNLKSPGVGGSGLLSPSTLEASAVDLSTEFTGLITTQRAYSAASKIITTADDMLAELISIKR
ncbi:flagellar hook protein FlgE [Asticcacaulis endophyticus]|jgi:flagellar hook protein FlgE|uniref:Flagellar hook protein FlgE n=1 Tax=Asticcacaulis endophyticus TaxID=1395890 RepID=A0A918UM28_9CAUL|nr:flagellar hook protein FlgE [Asticcacaulis endophyticus]GGZ19734.1 hypothetical protein GCM10011273_00300 [Asticcacaulis endophyticus]